MVRNRPSAAEKRRLLTRLKNLVDELYSWQGLAAALWVSRQTLLRWRTGESFPRRRHLVRLELVERALGDGVRRPWELERVGNSEILDLLECHD
ncbi:MAG: hypothetical protein E2P02_02665 [Acidobacteria bacterium]|nr:MAG: hypothetical protein E2P02_02665 [Acidobacteriota bacterium]